MMKETVFLASLAVMTSNVFGAHGDLVELCRTDSSRFQLVMTAVSESLVNPAQKDQPEAVTIIDLENSEKEPGLLQYDLRKRKRVTYVQPEGSGYSQFPEQDNPQDLNYIPNKKLRLKLNKCYSSPGLNLIKNKDVFKKYKIFNNVKNLVLTVGDLQNASKFEFPNLKELSVDILIKSAKPQKNLEPHKKMRQLVLEELFSQKNQRKLRNHRLEKEYEKSLKKRESRLKKNQLNEQLLREKLPILLSKTCGLENLSIRYTSCRDLPVEIWNLTQLKNLILKKLELSELSSNIGNLTNLETLDLSNNKVKTLPKEISKLINLKELYLIGNNDLLEFPQVIEQLTSLKVLNIDERQNNLWKESLQKLKKINKNLKIEIW